MMAITTSSSMSVKAVRLFMAVIRFGFYVNSLLYKYDDMGGVLISWGHFNHAVQVNIERAKVGPIVLSSNYANAR